MAKKRSEKQQKSSGMSRRSLLKAGGAVTLAGAFLGQSASSASAADGGMAPGSDFDTVRNLGASREDYWDPTGTYFVQKNVDTSRLDRGIIRARIEGVWQEYLVSEVDDAFFTFNMAQRRRMLDVMSGKKPLAMYNDAHNAAVGTYGSNRGDSRFCVNVAFKGMGWVPKAEFIDARADEYQINYKASMMTKMQILTEGYDDVPLWDRRLIGSLELYTTASYETHSFLNQMVNPVSTICTLADESYEFRVVARLMHPKDPGLTDYEKKLVKWINYAHDFFHGGPDPMKLTVHNIGVAYWVIEEFDNSPWGATKTAGGKKRVPLP